MENEMEGMLRCLDIFTKISDSQLSDTRKEELFRVIGNLSEALYKEILNKNTKSIETEESIVTSISSKESEQ